MTFKANPVKIIQDFLANYKNDPNHRNALLLINPYNRFWFTDFPSSAGFLLITTDHSILYLDGRYIEAAQSRAQNCDEIKSIVANSSNSFLKTLATDLQRFNINELLFDKGFMTYRQWEQLQPLNKKLIPVSIDEIRAVKSDVAIARLEKACQISLQALKKVLPLLQPGISEKAFANKLVAELYNQGADKISFDPIVVSGARGALPHGNPSLKIMNNNEYVTIDFGVYFKGYASDITRTIAIGTPSQKMQKIYNIVAAAQVLGIKAIRPGINSEDIDKICRDYIKAAGYGKYFVHSTGHGLGVEVHEFPRVSPFAKTLLQPGMIITVEPGIYIPGEGGVRIEDDVLVTADGYKVLSKI